MRIFVIAKEGEDIPKWYGAAYHDPAACLRIVSPIPLNLVIRAIIFLYRWTKYNFYMKASEVWNMAYRKGREDERALHPSKLLAPPEQ